MPHLGNAVKEYIDLHLVNSKSNYCFIKEPSINNIEVVTKLFPNSPILLLIRDGRDVVASVEKGYLLKLHRYSFGNRLKRKMNSLTGRHFKKETIAWRNRAEKLKNFIEAQKENKNVLLVKYEDLATENQDVIKKMMIHCGLTYNKDWFKNIEVIGSSFSKDGMTFSKDKAMWEKQERSKNFKPIGRWNSWSLKKKAYFKKIAGEQLNYFGYNDWNE